MKTPDISTIHETVLHGDMRFHLMVHEFASDPSRSERVTSHWHEEYELLFLTEGNGTAHVNGRALPISAGDILFFNSGRCSRRSGADIYRKVPDNRSGRSSGRIKVGFRPAWASIILTVSVRLRKITR